MPRRSAPSQSDRAPDSAAYFQHSCLPPFYFRDVHQDLRGSQSEQRKRRQRGSVHRPQYQGQWRHHRELCSVAEYQGEQCGRRDCPRRSVEHEASARRVGQRFVFAAQLTTEINLRRTHSSFLMATGSRQGEPTELISIAPSQRRLAATQIIPPSPMRSFRRLQQIPIPGC